MNRNRFVLLRILLMSTSRINKIRNSKDKKTKNKAVGGLVGFAVLFIMIMAYSAWTCIGYGQLGLSQYIPDLFVTLVSALAFIFTLFKTNGYLFAFKEYDMLMSLPFQVKTIAADKFLYMYVVSMPWFMGLSIPMLVVYGVYEKPSILAYIIWLILTLVVPVLPMLGAALVGFLFAKISTGFKKKNIIQTILMFAFVLFCFSLQYIIETLVKNDDTKEILKNISLNIEKAGGIYVPIKWFGKAVHDISIIHFAGLILVTIFVFEVVFVIVGKYYRQINSSLKSHSASKNFTMTRQKKHSVANSIAFKEFKRMTGSQTYLVNAAMGVVLAVILGCVSLFFQFDTIIKVITKGAPMDSGIVFPAIPLIVYFLVGMVATTAISPSIEGKNYWIMQSLPIDKKTIYKGKMLFNLYLTIPVAVFTTVCLSISAGVRLVDMFCYIIEIVALCCFSTTWGCVCGIKHIKLDWENEIEVVKQGAALTTYLFSNMFGCMGLVVLVVFLGLHINAIVLSFLITLIALALAALSYRRVLKLAYKC